MRRRRDFEIFSMSFLDAICCGFGAMILLFLVIRVGEPDRLEESMRDLDGLIAQYEQELNARYTEALGYGARAKQHDIDVVAGFLDRIPEYVRALENRPRADNAVLFGCLDELLGCIARGEKRPKRLESPAPGKWEPKA